MMLSCATKGMPMGSPRPAFRPASTHRPRARAVLVVRSAQRPSKAARAGAALASVAAAAALLLGAPGAGLAADRAVGATVIPAEASDIPARQPMPAPPFCPDDQAPCPDEEQGQGVEGFDATQASASGSVQLLVSMLCGVRNLQDDLKNAAEAAKEGARGLKEGAQSAAEQAGSAIKAAPGKLAGEAERRAQELGGGDKAPSTGRGEGWLR